MKALINKVIPYSFIDGPGSRMVIFMQGCNMRCLYCHNPETQKICKDCGACLEICPSGAISFVGERLTYNDKICRNCDRCLAECLHFSSPKCREVTVAEIYQQIDTVRDFLDGVTVSGGEASLQSDFLFELFQMVKNADPKAPVLTTFLDTNGLLPKDVLKKLYPVTDGFMVDLKAYDPVKHLNLTGVENGPILENIKWLGATGSLFEIRTVIVPGFTDNETEIANIAVLVLDLNYYTKLKLIPFRPLGVKTSMRDVSPLSEQRFQELSQTAHQILGERVITVSS